MTEEVRDSNEERKPAWEVDISENEEGQIVSAIRVYARPGQIIKIDKSMKDAIEFVDDEKEDNND